MNGFGETATLRLRFAVFAIVLGLAMVQLGLARSNSTARATSVNISGALDAVAGVPAASASAKPVSALFYTPGDIAACGMADRQPSVEGDSVVCSYGAPAGVAYAQLTSDGKVTICTPHHHPMRPSGGNCLYFGSVLKNAVHYPAGKTVNVGRFQCKVLAAGVQCTVRSTGQGFRILRHTAARIR